MTSITIIYDPYDRFQLGPNDRDVEHNMGVKIGRICVSDKLDGVDIYHAARKLAEVLLENVEREEEE